MSMELISREDALREADYLILETGYDNEKVEEMLKELPTVKAIPIDQYEARLKADMVAMLTEIQMEIREYHEIGCDEDCNNCCMVGCIEPVNVIKDLDIIQQKIDKLKEVEQ